MTQYCAEVSRSVSFRYRPVVDTHPYPGRIGEKCEYGPETTGTKVVRREICVAGGRGPGETRDQLYTRMREALPKAIALWNKIPSNKLGHSKPVGIPNIQVTYPLKGNDVVDEPETTDRCGLLNLILGTCGAVAESSNDYRDPKTEIIVRKRLKTAGASGGCGSTGLSNNDDDSTKKKSNRPTGACFSGQMNVMLKDGGTMRLGQLAYLNENGQELPEIASFDTEARKIVYQRPSGVVTHSTSGLLNLGFEGERSSLEVTGNHPMLVRRNGLEGFIPVQQIQQGDCLVSPLGECAQYQSGKTFMSQGTDSLYDISMPVIHNFLICTTDDKCYVGHNKVW